MRLLERMSQDGRGLTPWLVGGGLALALGLGALWCWSRDGASTTDSGLAPEGARAPASSRESTLGTPDGEDARQRLDHPVPAAPTAAPTTQPVRTSARTAGRARLEVRIVDAHGRAAEGARVEAAPSGADPRRVRIGAGSDSVNEAGIARLSVSGDEPLALRVLGRVDGEVLVERALAPLVAEELRKLEVELPLVLRELVVQVQDDRGEHVGGGTLFVGQDRREVRFLIPTGGRVACGPVECGRITLQVIKSGFEHTPFRQLSVPADGTPIVLRLRRGFELRVDVIDTEGQPVRGGEVWARVDGRGASGSESAPGVYTLRDQPERELEVLVRVGGREYRRTCHPSIGRLEVVVPVHGALEVEWRRPPDWKKGPIQLLVEPLAPSLSDTNRQSRHLDEASGSQRFESLLPGRYRVRLEHFFHRTLKGSDVQPLTVEVEARRTTYASLEP